jgi:16S rRNA C967 or C1407 C5-methylase (RsmB/RsmF family)
MYSMQLPAAFTEQTRLLLGDERFERYLKAFDAEPPVSIRLNPLKAMDFHVADGEQVAWCPNGYYLNTRPNFTFDPLLHAGCYYVQEASSMFLDEVLRQWLPALTSIG